MKYRWEYRLDDRLCKEWFLYVEGITAPVVVESYFDGLQLLGLDHPLEPQLLEFFGETRQPLEIRPYEPVAVSRSTLECLGRMFVTRVETKEEHFKVWGLVNGNTWLHTPGDSGR